MHREDLLPSARAEGDSVSAGRGLQRPERARVVRVGISFLYAKGIRIFDYPRFAEPLRDRIRERAHEVCAAAGVQIEHVNKSHIRKEDLVSRVLAVRGDAPGLVHVLSAMESCPSYKPWLVSKN